MATIPSLLNDTANNITNQVAVASITPTLDGSERVKVLTEILNRGVARVAATGNLSTLSSADYKQAIVKNVGIFEDSPTGPADGSTIFAGVAGRFWVKIGDLSGGPGASGYNRADLAITGNDIYVVPVGKKVFMIDGKSTVNGTIKMGRTAGANDVLFDTDVVAGQWFGGSPVSIIGDPGTANIYITFEPVTPGSCILYFHQVKIN